MTDINRYNIKTIMKQLFVDIQSILISDWDPIMVGGNILLHDEYDRYILILMGYKEKAVVEDIYRSLEKFEDDIGIDTGCEVKRAVAKKLVLLLNKSKMV